MTEASERERRLLSLFPIGEICSVVLQSVINIWGFSLIKDGKKIRVKSGNADTGTTVDAGQPLDQELELLSKARINPDGTRYYQFGDDVYNEDQVGENFVFQIYSRYTGIPLDQDDELLFETSFAGYKIFPSKREPGDSLLSGEWLGEYTYGEGYGRSVQGKSEAFTLIMSVSDGGLKGTCIDHNKPGAQPCSINGIVFDNLIWFIKQYPVTYVIDDVGKSYPDESKAPLTIAYTGLYDTDNQCYKGIWHIENKQFWGGWSIRQIKTG
jgi:hypothetical protein